jgi:tetratricopeptide (TPR) repeat protein
MSLINRVLRDLDERETKSHKKGALSSLGVVRPVVLVVQKSKAIYISLTIVLAAGIGGIFGYQFFKQAPIPIEKKFSSESLPTLKDSSIILEDQIKSEVLTVSSDKNSLQESNQSLESAVPVTENSSSGTTTLQITPQQEAALTFETDGIQSLREGRPKSGEAQLRKSLELNPRLVKARLVLARHVESLNQRDEAILILSDGLMLLPNNQFLFLELARLNIRAGQSEVAYQLLRSALKKNQFNADLHGLFAELSKDKNLWTTAINHYRLALARKNEITWRIGLADSLLQIKELDAAKDQYKSILLQRNLTPQYKFYIEDKLKQLNS